ncbi:hypothetical protein RRG08_047957 [Elysia crispata]|uniref:Uncharacterized protein n=1 Tax=Elysia crispata TaxID=231223 RepID=A0AAE0ZVR7_9GAST|nr:hypothetical protein RRG08_047957 [Elysia crispata]
MACDTFRKGKNGFSTGHLSRTLLQHHFDEVICGRQSLIQVKGRPRQPVLTGSEGTSAGNVVLDKRLRALLYGLQVVTDSGVITGPDV